MKVDHHRRSSRPLVRLQFSRSCHSIDMHTFGGVAFGLVATVRPVSPERLRAAERALHCTFPGFYRDFVLKFGTGEFRELGLAALPPEAIISRTPDDQARFREFWFWDDSPEVWSREKACGSIACFDGTSGDDVRFHPSDPKSVYILPHDYECIYRVTSFAGLISCVAGIYEVTQEKLTFVPDQKDHA